MEATAVQSILDHYPSLLKISPWDQHDIDYQDYGGSWTKEMSEVCENGDGWDIYGIYCESGKVTGIRFTNAFGPNAASTLDLSGLEYLQRFTNRAELRVDYQPIASDVSAFLGKVLQLPSLRELDVEWLGDEAGANFPTTCFAAANLTHVKLDLQNSVPALNFASMTYLVEVDLNRAPGFSAFSGSGARLRSLTFRSAALTDLSGAGSLPALESLYIVAPYTSTGAYGTNFALPPNLKTLQLQGWGHADMNIGSITSTLETLELYVGPLLNRIVYLPPSLKSISIASAPYIQSWVPFTSPCHLESFKLSNTDKSPVPGGLSTCTSLNKFELHNVHPSVLDSILSLDLSGFPLQSLELDASLAWPQPVNLSAAESLICSAPSSLKRLNIEKVQLTSIIRCLEIFTQLESLIFNGNWLSSGTFHLQELGSSLTELAMTPQLIDAVGNPNAWLQMSTQFPNLKILTVLSQPLNYPLPTTALMNLTNLVDLKMTNLAFTGSLPPDFFQVLSNLETLDLSNNQLNGTIPGSGWSKLRSLTLSYNQFSDWPANSPAPLMEILTLSGVPLQSVPSDADFKNMPNLRYLGMANSPNLNAPLPRFWADGSHKLRFLVAPSSGFYGSLPATIQSPYLRTLDVQKNQLCGSLPEFAAPVALNYLTLNGNHFSGSIPDWSQNLTIAASLDLSNNLLEGTIPSPLLDLRLVPRVHLQIMKLGGNYLHGPVSNMTSYALFYFNVSGEYMRINWCAEDPEFQLSPRPTCYLTLDPSICGCSAPWSVCQGDVSDYCAGVPPSSEPSEISSPRPPIQAPYYPCTPMTPATPAITPPLDSPTSAICSSPSPAPAFICLGGTWTAVGSINVPELVVPGSFIAVDGNLTVSGGLTFTGLGSQVAVNGCIFLGEGEVTVELTKQELEQLQKEGKVSKTLISTVGSCSGGTDLSNIKINSEKGSVKDCRRAKTDTTGSTPTTLVVTFSIDSSKCNTKWIILGSVLGGVVVIGAIITALVVTFNPKARLFVRPFARA
jgi:Leucine-rich repeat (LRR) protein